ncbi:hypothetical protein HPB47_025875 [Ixodes persulcatus]|uniref:Uncharacterized protein n=1 Tax=Ixodes persulcatus TaxID=34615 RepID=A0AC60Q0Q4_IXOPE|nr:hypothetical protein HPB47_025875 [Ixodes persulcatus]
MAISIAKRSVKYIKKVDGYAGLYRGLSVRLVGNVVSGAVFSEVNRVREFEDEEDDDDITEEERIINFVKRTLKLMTAKCAALVCAQPFNVVTVRCMAQFVGREEKYAGIFSSIGEIYREEGIMGLFSGLVPRLIGEVLTIWFANTIAFVINAYIVQDKTLQSYISATTMFLSSSVTYPFTLVGTVMAVSGSSLQAGTPPAMPVYPSWTECWRHLSSTGQLKRGSAILWRYYQGPYIVDERGVPLPVGSVKLLKASHRHFRHSDYVAECLIRKLLPGAVPTVFEDYPSYLAPRAKKPRKDPVPRDSLPPRKPTKRKAEAAEYSHEVCDVSDGVPDQKPSVCTQTTNNDAQRASRYLSMIGRLRSQVAYYRSRRGKLLQQLAAERKVTSFYREDERYTSVKKIAADSEKGEKKALFLLHQIKSYGKKRLCYPEEIIGECVIWRFLSPKG